MFEPEMNRREWLSQGLGAAVIAGGGAIEFSGPCAAETAAFAPWSLWNNPASRGTPAALIAAGVLAASPHDTQPWLFRVRPDVVEVFADTSRHLGAMDPFLREMHIGLGCALENLAQAASANGFRAEIEPVAGALTALAERRGPVLAARVRLARAPVATSPLYAAIPRRHTNRYAYDRGRPLPEAWRRTMLALAADPAVRLVLFDEPRARRAYDAAMIDATQAIIADAPMIGDSDRWVRTTSAQVEAFRSGVTLETAGLSPLTLMLAKTFPVSAKTQHQAWLDNTRAQLKSAPLTGVLMVRDRYDRASALAAGRVWQRLHLAATVAGVAMQPLNQTVEMVDRERQLGRSGAWERRMAALTGGGDWAATFSFRMGYSTRPAPPSPRRALMDVVTS